MFSDTITVFNLHRDKLGDTWYPTVISNVDLIVDRGANIEKTGLDSADSAKLHVRYQNISGKMMIEGKEYLTEKAWNVQDSSDRSNTITFSEGKDFFVRGEYLENPLPDDGYGEEGFYTHMKNTYDDCYMINTVGGPYTLIPHFEIGGK